MKAQRHYAIMNIISRERIATQEELCEVLKRQGFDITQATVSRDIKELQLIKIPDSEGYRYSLPDNAAFKNSYERMKRIFQDSVVNIDCSENIIVIKTLPGAAQAVASMIDTSGLNRILGTVAGDDTILVVVKPIQAAEEVMSEFLHLIR
ncbi:arginine pathway regulatory protein argr, repressor of arg regulon [hydrocarbon metagenome]|uniref:Arginine pathway regulatory protein argr, repressor of arg regulon n=1 Tax=hydrocarbon metagenome TaxID=938273 RepID=A0A0W8E950_9ZZZZ